MNRHVVWVDDVVTVVPRPGTVIINNIAIHVDVAS
jgi:hypothetical protein